MKKPSPQTEIKNLKRALALREKDVVYFANQVKPLQHMVEVQGCEITEWKERFDTLLGMKGKTE